MTYKTNLLVSKKQKWMCVLFSASHGFLTRLLYFFLIGRIRNLSCASYRCSVDHWRKGRKLLLFFWRVPSVRCLSEVEDDINTSKNYQIKHLRPADLLGSINAKSTVIIVFIYSRSIYLLFVMLLTKMFKNVYIEHLVMGKFVHLFGLVQRKHELESQDKRFSYAPIQILK